MAITKFDQFDFLIDIVPRDDIKPAKREDGTTRTTGNPDQVSFYEAVRKVVFISPDIRI